MNILNLPTVYCILLHAKESIFIFHGLILLNYYYHLLFIQIFLCFERKNSTEILFFSLLLSLGVSPLRA